MLLEDDENLNRGIALKLQKEGYQVFSAFQISEAEKLFDENRIDLVISDITLPDGNGLEFCRKIRNKSKVFVLFLTAMDSEIDMVNGYDAGADDYITKPFQVSELAARVEAVLRRSSRRMGTVQVDDVRIDLDARSVTKAGVSVELTVKEYEILAELAAHKNVALSRAQLYEAVWNELYTGETRTLDCHIQKLRKKLGLEERIRTVFRVGYRLEV